MTLPETLAPATVGPSHSLDAAQTSIHRDELLREIAERRARQAASGTTSTVADVPATALADPLTDSILKLRSDDPEQIRHVLVSRALTPELIPHVVTLVNDERVLPEALRALRSVATSAAGQLTDALLDRYQHEHIRRRLPVVLAYSDSPMAITGLVAALDDTSWNVRCRAARALQTIKSRNSDATIREGVLLAAAERELRALVRNRHGSGMGSQGAIATSQRLEMIFLLLGALDDPGTIELCWNALYSGDPRLRGTALEYLENRLPPDFWQELHKVLAAEHGHDLRSGRSQQEAADELHAAAEQLRQHAPPVPVDSLAGVMRGGNRHAPAAQDKGKGTST
jgi:HEAT repeat protein